MVACGELPCTIANVASNLQKKVGFVSTSRAQLIRKGIIYSARYKKLDFTVPKFSSFIEQLDEYQQWYAGICPGKRRKNKDGSQHSPAALLYVKKKLPMDSAPMGSFSFC